MSETLLDKKLEHWEHQLLDLGKRNKLIHYRETKRATIRLIEPSFNELYERIAVNEETLSFQRTVDKETDIRVFSLLALMECLSTPLPVTIGDIKTTSSIAERQITLRNMRNKARLSLEEQGSNILYLSFGFLEWSNGKGASVQRLKSPLLLVPAVLTIEALNAPYALSKHEDDIVINPTLTYFLRSEYGIELPPFDAETETLDGYLKELEDMADQRGWRILQEVSLGLLSFQKIAMYNDLLNNEARIKSNPIIRAMSGDYEEANRIPDDLQSIVLDSIHARDCYQVMSADSSQQDAIMYSKNNVSYVMQGPPGTGKSQTITNIIAEALADGKRVLFVSEKMAALQVVNRRLQEVHLSDFCLPLHSYKANKKEILEQIGQNLTLKQKQVKSSAISHLDDLSDIRQTLQQYATQLHKCQGNLDMSCYEVYSELERVHNVPTVSFTFTCPLSMTQTQLQSCLSRLKEYDTSIKQIDYCIQNNPWDGLSSKTVSYEYVDRMHTEATRLQEALQRIIEIILSVPQGNKFSEKLDFHVVDSFAKMLDSISQIPEVQEAWLGNFDMMDAIRTASEAEKIQNKLFALKKEIEHVFYKSIYTFEYNDWELKLSHLIKKLQRMPYFPSIKPYEFAMHCDDLKVILTTLQDNLVIANVSFSKVRQLCGVPYISSLKGLQDIQKLLPIVEDDIVIPTSWFVADTQKIKNRALEAKDMSEHFQSYKEQLYVQQYLLEVKIDHVFIKDVYSYNYNGWRDAFLDGTSVLENLQYITFLSPADLILRKDRILKCFITLKKDLMDIDNLFKKINNMLGTTYSSSKDGYNAIKSIYKILCNGFTIPCNWLSSGTAEVFKLCIEAKEKASRYQIITSRVTQEFESGILEFDFAPMVQRFESHYKNVLKVFRPQYYQDRKQVFCALKNKNKKLSDDMIIALLQSIKEYQDIENWFRKNETILSEAFCVYNNGIDSNFDSILEVLKCSEELRNVFHGAVPQDLIKIVSAKYQAQTTSLSSYLSILVKLYCEIDNISKENQNDCRIDLFPAEANLIIAILTQYITEIEAISSQLNIISQFFQKSETEIDMVLLAIDALNMRDNIKSTLGEEHMDVFTNPLHFDEMQTLPTEWILQLLYDYQKTVAWFDANNIELASIYCDYYFQSYTNWDIVIHGIETVERLKHSLKMNVPDRLKIMLSRKHAQQIDALKKEVDILKTTFENIETISINKHISLGFESPNFSFDNSLSVIDTYFYLFNELSKQMDRIDVFLVNDHESIERIYDTIEKLNKHMDIRDLYRNQSHKYKEIAQIYFHDEFTDWNKILDLLNKLLEIKQSDFWDSMLYLINIPSKQKEELQKESQSILNMYRISCTSLEWIAKQFNNSDQWSEWILETLVKHIKQYVTHIDTLKGWVDYQEAREACFSNHLRNYIEAIEAEELLSDIKGSFLKGFYQQWLSAAYENLEAVRRFRKSTQDERIQRFAALDDLQLSIAQMRIREKLIQKLPTTSPLLKATDEVSILKKELNKKRNIMPLRKLFRQIPNLLMQLKPCLMMSPLSVSYFLEAEAYHFDLVIFDEASQIFPEDAIGAIFRGTQVIIAGDTKQLPPTHFFAASTNNSDGVYDIDAEDDIDEIVSNSILEEAASVLPNRTLLWHYRSKQEDLIAFSNREIYKNNLITFPSSITNQPDMGVEYIYVEDGYYEGCGKNCNIREAQKCVMLVLKHIQNHPNRSLGIIAFSEKQQTAIENAINDFRTRLPQYEWFFDENSEEPFFVKNLENVQGDERDTIIFSICYAKDSNGRMYMRFGPLGQAGGERRLNVAITRAKCNVKLVGSILPTDIDLTRTNAEGVRMLRSYIEFARKGGSTLAPVKNFVEQEDTDDFCKIVAAFLESNGYVVKKGIGCSDYKIDIAIENPNVAGEYIAGIECDGLSYIHAKTVRDRDHLRRSILENMGWNMYRIWSTEWCRNPETEGNALLAFIRSLFDENGNVRHILQQEHENAHLVCIDEIISNEKTMPVTMDEDNPYGFAYYKEAKWWEVTYNEQSNNVTRICKTALYIVGIEQPMHKDLFYKRMADSFTAGRATQGVRDTIDNVMEKELSDQIAVDADSFVRLKPLSPITVRIPKKWDTPRPMDYISTIEVAKAMVKIINHSYGLLQDDIATECARVFGFDRKGAKIKAKTDDALSYLVNHGIIKILDGKVQATGGMFYE